MQSLSQSIALIVNQSDTMRSTADYDVRDCCWNRVTDCPGSTPAYWVTGSLFKDMTFSRRYLHTNCVLCPLVWQR